MSFLLAGESNLEASAIHWFSTVWKTGRYLWCRSYLPFIVRNLTIMVPIILSLVLLIQDVSKFYFSHALRENPYCTILYENNLSHFVTGVSGWRKKDSNQQIFWLMYCKGFFLLFWSVSHKPKMSRKTASSFLNVTPVFDVNVHSAKQLRQFIYTSLSIIPSLLDSGSFSSKVCILPLNSDLRILKNHNNKNNLQFRTELSIL